MANVVVVREVVATRAGKEGGEGERVVRGDRPRQTMRRRPPPLFRLSLRWC